MKNFSFIKVTLALIFCVMGVAILRGETAEFSWSGYDNGVTTIKVKNITLTGGIGSASTTTRIWNETLRTYAGSTATFSADEGYVITAISGYSPFNYSNATGDETITFSDLAKATCSSTITVTYKSSSTSTKYTVV